MSFLTTLGGLGIAFAGYPAARRIGGRFDAPAALPGDGTLREDLLKWLVAGVLLAYVIGVEGRSFVSIGATLPPAIPVAGGVGGAAGLLAWWVGGLVGTIALSTVSYNLYRHYDLDIGEAFADDQAERAAPLFLCTAVTAGVTESVLYQAYPIERLATLSGSVVVAGLLAWVVFTAVHYVTGRFSLQATVYTSVPALAVTVLYVLSGSVYVVVLVHATVNAMSFLSR